VPTKTRTEDSLRVLTAIELAELLRVGVTTVHRWARRGVIPSIRVGRVVRFNLHDVREALREPGDNGR
jgi:excisionase family DNA binding protein